MVKDIITYNDKSYQLSTCNVNGILETMIFPIKNGIISGSEVYCFRTEDAGKSMDKHGDIYYHPEKYISDEAIQKYLKEKEEIYGPPMKEIEYGEWEYVIDDFDDGDGERLLPHCTKCHRGVYNRDAGRWCTFCGAAMLNPIAS